MSKIEPTNPSTNVPSLKARIVIAKCDRSSPATAPSIQVVFCQNLLSHDDNVVQQLYRPIYQSVYSIHHC